MVRCFEESAHRTANPPQKTYIHTCSCGPRFRTLELKWAGFGDRGADLAVISSVGDQWEGLTFSFVPLRLSFFFQGVLWFLLCTCF